MPRLAAHLAFLTLIACGSDTTDSDIITPNAQTGTGTGGAGTGTGAATGTGTGGGQSAEDCPWVGTWIVDQTLCGMDPYDDWFTYYDEVRMDIVHGQIRGCDIVATWANSNCSGSGTWFADPDPGDKEVEILSDGITDCSPPDCQFAGTDSPCTMGERATEITALVDQRLGSGRLMFTHLGAFAAPTCSDAFSMRFLKQ